MAYTALSLVACSFALVVVLKPTDEEACEDEQNPVQQARPGHRRGTDHDDD